ncbi:MAG: arginyltransferase [Ectothiorhodospiraceae bacterium]|nr:arginyltransferase [Ectothiorhodospiraceae bacterium]
MDEAGTPPDGKRQLWLYATGEHSCSYLDDRLARTVFADPEYPMNNRVYGALLRQGMRRSGGFVYQPGCAGCSACKSLRIPVERFRPNRSQRRCWKQNADVKVVQRPAAYSEDQFRLYKHYLRSRHPGSGMDSPEPEKYMEFLTASWSNTLFCEFRLGRDLLGVAVTDVVPDGLSAVYTFFNPALTGRSLGTLGILWQIEEARRLELPYVYLGYWIAEADTMRYKARFRPAEIYTGGRWRILQSGGEQD